MRLTDPILNQLVNRLGEEIAKRAEVLANGSAITHGENGLADATNTAMKYREDVAWIKAFNQVIELCHEIDVERYSSKKKDDGED